ncbi:hypothetical protein CQW23_14795 [Capsicum baccatum]|uniref:Uncharacterized protein n=1 Tax=Capsicum baccatum TaxID=33114 RepID=A0A2G2WK67_CAPBA|nr:hypothetical protein CQW23_14795 [Capsicum baccatum]
MILRNILARFVTSANSYSEESSVVSCPKDFNLSSSNGALAQDGSKSISVNERDMNNESLSELKEFSNREQIPKKRFDSEEINFPNEYARTSAFAKLCVKRRWNVALGIDQNTPLKLLNGSEKSNIFRTGRPPRRTTIVVAYWKVDEWVLGVLCDASPSRCPFGMPFWPPTRYARSEVYLRKISDTLKFVEQAIDSGKWVFAFDCDFVQLTENSPGPVGTEVHRACLGAAHWWHWKQHSAETGDRTELGDDYADSTNLSEDTI